VKRPGKFRRFRNCDSSELIWCSSMVDVGLASF
jgi:hypothetical protein